MTHPATRELFQSAARQPDFQALLQALTRGERGPFSLSGLVNTAKALYLVLLYQATEKPLFVLVDGNKQAESLLESVEVFFNLLLEGHNLPKPQLIPALDVLPQQRLSPHNEIAETRAVGLWRLSAQRIPITVVPVASALLRIEAASFYRQLALTLRAGEDIPLEDLIAHLESIGYERREPVEMVGEYSVRGGILDVFAAESQRPIRVELFGDLIESIRQFDVESQRSVLKIPSANLLPLAEYPRSPVLLRQLAEVAENIDLELSNPGEVFPGWEYLVPLVRPRTHHLFSLQQEATVILDEPDAIAAAADRLWQRLERPDRPAPIEPEKNFLRWEELREDIASRTLIGFRELELLTAPLENAPTTFHIPTRPSLTFQGNMPVAVGEARNLIEAGNRVAFFAASTGELERVADVLQEYAVPYRVGIDSISGARPSLVERAYHAGSFSSAYLIKGRVRRGAVLTDSLLAILGSEDLFETSDLIARQPMKSSLAAFAADIADLKPGDFVVHTTHGVGQFLGIREIVQGDQKGDFMLLEYAGESKLYVPLTRLDLVQKYRGAGEAKPHLDRLGGVTWEKTKSRVKAKMRDMADELLKLYAQRRMSKGFSFSADGNWQREFEDAFEYSATKDQLQAVKQIKADMESEQPMDRLLCGDVGFGKTEVAMRAAFKAMGDGKQVAVLAPTTVLSFQHYETFKRRFASFPVRIELVSRFRSPKEIKAVLEDLSAGKVDVLIGTHRVFSKDVQFQDLGLLIVDEEQRFGVSHKERLKQMRHNVDVLTMSATPIPRTLHMSLLGLRDMSVIETAPKDRLAINTVVAHFNQDLIKSAIEQELSRQGQVYFVHNRVDTIFMRAASIQELLPQCRIGVGHGQMGEAELEKVLLGFMRHEYDVFVCTTIVENGLDIPLANTIVIENAERYGLSELYQLRGRVGRSNRRAYAYLMVPADTQLSDVARKRLAALKEFSDLGAGFKIAALDLELRGAGNLLGGEQHGHIEAVGYDTYVRLLEETVKELKGEEVPLEIHATLNLGIDIRIPSTYIGDETQRLRSYKRIADIKDEEDAKRLAEEIADRYGPVPEEVDNLIRFARLKSLAERTGVESIDRRQGFANIKFHQQSKVDPFKLMALIRNTASAQFTPAGVLKYPMAANRPHAALLEDLRNTLLDLTTSESGGGAKEPAGVSRESHGRST
ncbi:MAG TPA: transcription-repair coupling factor [Bryobacteraceae bacterium]|nr:transcription-repair coupling factor [Bryobacteraceae bacterium]